MTDHVIDSACPQCGVPFEVAAIQIGADGPPVPGDPVVCRKCGARLVFDVGRRLRSLTRIEFLAFKAEVQRAINAARRAALQGDSEMVKPDVTLLVACVALCSVVEVLSW